MTAGLLITAAARAGEARLTADGPGETYERIRAAGFGIESPDQNHPVRHITEEIDPELGRPVFVFTIHVKEDDDRGIASDRQRLEIKGGPGSPGVLRHEHAVSTRYQWLFRLDAGFQPSGNFTHIFQLKAKGGADEGAPILTLTPRQTDQGRVLQVIHVPSRGNGRGRVVTSVPLDQIAGRWVRATIELTHREDGRARITLQAVGDDEPVLDWQADTIDLWRSGADYNRPKLGIYRSLRDANALRDEAVLIADVTVIELTAED